MRVLMTTDTVGGVWTYALDLIDALAPHDVRVVLATMGPLPDEGQHRALATSAVEEVHEGGFKLEWMEDPWDDVAAAGTWLLDLEQRVRPAVVHLNVFAHGALPFTSPALVVAHSCVLSWWRAVKGAEAPPEWDRYAAAVRRGLLAADAVVAPTRWMAAAVEDLYRPPRGCGVIPNGRRMPAASDAKVAVVAAVGRFWDEGKNVAALRRVAGGLPWPVHVAGEPPTPGDEFVALGRLPAEGVDALLARAAIFASPARYEPFGLAVLEAALARCALVLGDIPSLRENWEGCAVFVDPGDDEALTAELLALMEDAPRRRQLGDRAWRRASSFTPERMARDYSDLYRTLASTAAAEGA